MKSSGARLLLVCGVVASLVIAFVAPVKAIKDESLVLFLTFDEGDGSEAADLSGNSNTGTLVGDPVWDPDGMYGNAISFDGADDHVIVTDSGFTTMGEQGSSYTIEFWIKTAQTGVGVWYQVPAIMSKRGVASKFRVFTFYLTQDGGVGLHFEAPQEDLVSASVINDNKWHHVAATRDGENASLYVDGDLEVSDQITDNDKSAPEEPAIIGARFLDSGQPSRFLQGSLDEVAFYNRALTEEQIKADIQSGVLAVSAAGKLATTWASIKK